MILESSKDKYQSQAHWRLPERRYGPVTASRKAARSGSLFRAGEVAVRELRLDRVVTFGQVSIFAWSCMIDVKEGNLTYS